MAIETPQPGKPTVSIAIVTRNRAEELAEALRSVEQQSLAPDDIVVIDNASDDNTLAMLAAEFPDVRVIRLHHNIGCQPARNIAMANCTGSIIFNLDDDGTLHPNALKNVVDCFNGHPEAGLVAASVKVPEAKAKEYPNNNEDAPLHYTSQFFGGAHAIRSAVLHDAGYFPEYFRGHSESDLALRIINSGWEILYNPQVVMYHHISGIERNRNTEAYYQVKHQLETSVRLQPADVGLAQVGWRIAQGLPWSLKRKTFRGYAKGVFAFLGSLPRLLRNRKPVSRSASRKHHYLKHHQPAHLSDMPAFSGYSLRQMIISRFKTRKPGK